MPYRDSAAALWGKAAEAAVRSAYISLGKFVIPAHAIEDGGAPMLIGRLKKYVLPDFMVAQGGISGWVEVKGKTCPVLFRKTGFYRHGVDLPNWEAYLKVQEISGIAGSLAIVQYKGGALAAPDPVLLSATFEHLAKVAIPEAKPTPSAPRGMVYWDIDEFDTICKLPMTTFAELPELPRTIHVWETRGRLGKAPQANMAEKQRSLLGLIDASKSD